MKKRGHVGIGMPSFCYAQFAEMARASDTILGVCFWFNNQRYSIRRKK